MIRIELERVASDLVRQLETTPDATILVVRDGTPIAEIRPLPPRLAAPRPLGLGRGRGEVPPSFFDPLPDDLSGAFGGERG